LSLVATTSATLRPLHPDRVAERRLARQSRNAVIEWVADSGCNWCLTLNPNRALPLQTEVQVLRHAFRDADEALLGHRYRQKDARRRLLAFIFAEHVTSNIHFHLAIRPGLDTTATDEEARLRRLTDAWSARVPSGTYDLNPATNTRGWARYITKEGYSPEHQFWTSSMWWPAAQRKHVLDRSWRDEFS